MNLKYLSSPLLFLIIIGGVLLYACGDNNNDDDNPPPPPPPTTTMELKSSPKFNADSAYNFVKAQVDFGPRVPNTRAHEECGDYLLAKLDEFGWKTIAQTFDATAYNGEILKSRNIIGIFNPTASKRILLGAHWDARPYNDKEVEDSTQFKPIDGANDGASGVGVLLEIARVIGASENKPEVGIDIIFFDSEDYGHPENYDGQWKPDFWCLGSQHWGKNPHIPNYSAYYGILLDMVGARGAQFYREGYSMKYPKVVDNVWKIAKELGYINFFKFQNSPEITDDHVYVNRLRNIPMIDIIEYDPGNPSYFGEYHHTSRDNMNIIDPQTLKAVGHTVLQALYNEEVKTAQ